MVGEMRYWFFRNQLAADLSGQPDDCRVDQPWILEICTDYENCGMFTESNPLTCRVNDHYGLNL
jgi:hypothetical protein